MDVDVIDRDRCFGLYEDGWLAPCARLFFVPPVLEGQALTIELWNPVQSTIYDNNRILVGEASDIVSYDASAGEVVACKLILCPVHIAEGLLICSRATKLLWDRGRSGLGREVGIKLHRVMLVSPDSTAEQGKN